MGKISWQKRINHFDRPVSKLNTRRWGLNSRFIKDKVRERRGLPSRSTSSELMRLKMDLMFAKYDIKRGNARDIADVEALKKRIAWEDLRSRLLERKRRQKAEIRARKITADRTNIYLWKRRQEWLREVEKDRSEPMSDCASDNEFVD